MRCLVVLLSLLLLFPYGTWADELPVVRMASLQNDLHHLPLWVAQALDLYRVEGVKVEQTATFRAGPELMSAMVAGSIDMAFVGEAPATITFARGAKVALVAQVNTGGSALVVSTNCTAQKITDLKGKRIAVPGNGTVQDFLLRRALNQKGISFKEVKIITLSPPEMAQALKAGQIDAFLVWQPYPARAVQRGEGRILMDSSELWPNHPCCALISSESARTNGLAARVVRAHKKAITYIKEHPDEAIAIAVQKTGMDETTVREALAHVVYTHVPAVAEEEEYVNFLHSLGYIKQGDARAFTREFIHSLVD